MDKIDGRFDERPYFRNVFIYGAVLFLAIFILFGVYLWYKRRVLTRRAAEAFAGKALGAFGGGGGGATSAFGGGGGTSATTNATQVVPQTDNQNYDMFYEQN